LQPKIYASCTLRDMIQIRLIEVNFILICGPWQAKLCRVSLKSLGADALHGIFISKRFE